MRGAFCATIHALVLAGLATTSTRTSGLAKSFSALPWGPKMGAFLAMRSFLSIPGPRGKPPTSTAMSTSLQASSRLKVVTTPHRHHRGEHVADLACRAGDEHALGLHLAPLSQTQNSGCQRAQVRHGPLDDVHV